MTERESTMKETGLVKKNHLGLINKVLSLLMVAAGGIIVCLPLYFWDFLITYQFKPTTRPYYPLFYGALLAAGIIIALFGFLGLFKRFNREPKRGNILSNFLLPLLAIAVGAGVFAGTGNLYATSQYLAADNLYLLILTGLVLGIVLCLLLVPAGISAIVNSIRKKSISRTVRRANASAFVFLLMGAIVAGVIMLPPDAKAKPFPADLFHTVLYAQGDGGYDTVKIPTMITAPNGTILSFGEARVGSQEDWAKTDVVLRKSYDMGNTWTPLKVLISDGNLTIGNACPVVDESTGYIWLIFCKQNDRVFKMHSVDNGESWTTPVEITKDVKLAGWRWYATGPSQGIQLKDGTLVIPADHIANRKMNAQIIYSKDNGSTWKLGGSIPGGEEATLVQLDNGDLYINIRPVKPGFRVTAVSSDEGLTWHNISHDKSLPDPACQGNIIKIYKPGGSLYLFTNAADSLYREKMTVRLSNDECKTWSKSKVLYSGLASYSALSLIDAKSDTIGCIFESGANYYAEKIVFVRFSLDYINN